MSASGEPGDGFGSTEGIKFEGDTAMATLWTLLMTLRTYWRAIVATLSARLFSNGNWKAMVNTDLVLGHADISVEPWFDAGLTSRLEVRSSVLCVVTNAFFPSP